MWRLELTVTLIVFSLLAPAAKAVSIDSEEQGFVDEDADAIVIEGWIKLLVSSALLNDIMACQSILFQSIKRNLIFVSPVLIRFQKLF